jgi:hypothetical protein
MPDHRIPAVSNIEHSLAFCEAAFRPLNSSSSCHTKARPAILIFGDFGDRERAFFWIKQGKPDRASIHWGSSPKIMVRLFLAKILTCCQIK